MILKLLKKLIGFIMIAILIVGVVVIFVYAPKTDVYIESAAPLTISDEEIIAQIVNKPLDKVSEYLRSLEGVRDVKVTNYYNFFSRTAFLPGRIEIKKAIYIGVLPIK